MSYSLRDLIYMHSKSHGDQLKVGLDFHGADENKYEKLSPYHKEFNSNPAAAAVKGSTITIIVNMVPGLLVLGTFA